MFTTTCYRMLRLTLFLLAATICYCGNASHAAAQGACPDNGTALPKNCAKEIRIWNNTSGTIYPVLQGSIQLTDALGCTKAAKGGGDVWLQAALGSTNRCYSVKNDYYVYINPTTGVPANSFVSINVPWWSKRQPGAPDAYVDWWRGARVIIFDDQTAFNDSYSQLKDTTPVVFVKGSPVVSCNSVAGNACNPAQLQIFQVTPAAEIATQTPFQLNEFTFADVSAVTDGGTKGGKFIDFNQNYNVSNVDQTYLPIAIEPVRSPPDIGYMGTTMSVAKFRQRLKTFVGLTADPPNLIWPIYNNPVVSGSKPIYPNAGIRVPSAQTVFSFYTNPSYFPLAGKIPQIVPTTPPKLVADMMKRWTSCTAAESTTCGGSQAKIYQEINTAFLDNYKNYLDTCKDIPNYLQPVSGSSPSSPELTAVMTFVLGWVPFNVNCANQPLPTANQPPSGNRTPIDYINVQYNYEDLTLASNEWFNPYTKLIHGQLVQGDLAASAYAFSIDDHASFQSNSGGLLPGGLIIAVGGSKGLPNPNQVPPPLPPFYPYFDFSVGLGAPQADGAYWLKYGICSDKAATLFPGRPTDGYVIGIDPAVQKISASNVCTITLMDSKNRLYQLDILKAGTPPNPIWPPFQPSAGKNFSPSVLACPATDGYVPPEQWCNFTNQVANPTPSPPIYAIGARSPLP